MFNITFQQIETFLTVAKCLNLSKAGEMLFASQPSLSKTLKRFEEGVGMRLFKSSNRGMALTSDGEYLYAILEPLYRTIDKSILSAQNNATTPLRILRIVQPSAYDHTEDFNQLKTLVGAYECKYPDVKVQELLCDFRELRQSLEYGSADLVFAEDFSVRDIPNISIKLLSQLDMYIAISGKHPLTKSDKLDINALCRETLFTLPTLTNEQDDIQTQLDACGLIGFTPRRIEFMSNYQTLLHAVILAKGICFSARSSRHELDGDIKYYPVNLQITPSISVAWRTNKLSNEAKNFINMLPNESERDSLIS